MSESSFSTTTSMAAPISIGGARSKSLFRIDQATARRMVPRCGAA